MYTLDGEAYSESIGATYATDDDAEDITGVWYIEPEALFGESTTVIGYIGELFDETYSSWTVTINGEEYTWDGNDFKDADGEEVTSLDAGTYTVVWTRV